MRRAFDDLLALPSGFPLLRPDSDDFEDWLTAHQGDSPTQTLLEEGIELLGEREATRIAHSCSRWFPQMWAGLVADIKDEVAAEAAVVVGAVAAALAELRLPDEFVLELLEENARPADPVGTLALCLEATDLWSVLEAVSADRAVARIPDELDDEEYAQRSGAVLEREAARLLTRHHRRRLSLIVKRLSCELPIDGFPRASDAIALACAAFERDRSARSRVAAMLLGDVLGPLHQHRFRLAA